MFDVSDRSTMMTFLPASLAAPLISWELIVPELSISWFLKISCMTRVSRLPSTARSIHICVHSRDLLLTKYFWILLQSKWNSIRPNFPLSSFWRALRVTQEEVNIHLNSSSNWIISMYVEDTSSRLIMRWPVSRLKPSVLMSHPKMCLEGLKIIMLSWKTALYLRVPILTLGDNVV